MFAIWFNSQYHIHMYNSEQCLKWWVLWGILIIQILYLFSFIAWFVRYSMYQSIFHISLFCDFYLCNLFSKSRICMIKYSFDSSFMVSILFEGDPRPDFLALFFPFFPLFFFLGGIFVSYYETMSINNTAYNNNV